MPLIIFNYLNVIYYKEAVNVMEKITITQALNKTVVATKNYIDKTVTIVDTDLQQVIYDIYGSISEESPIEGFISYDESTKTINIKGLNL